MDLKKAIDKRRAYRTLEPLEITRELIEYLALYAQKAPSCFNNQPWRFVFVQDPKILARMHGALSKGNAWAHAASMIIAVFSRKDLDCVVGEREYFLFDAGMASAYMLLLATERGMVAHPIAGFNEDRTKEILQIPREMRVITLIIVGGVSDKISPRLSEKQAEAEKTRPERFPLEKFVYIDTFKEESD